MRRASKRLCLHRTTICGCTVQQIVRRKELRCSQSGLSSSITPDQIRHLFKGESSASCSRLYLRQQISNFHLQDCMSAIMHTKSTNSKSSCILHMKISNILKYTCAIYVQTTICCQSACSNANVYPTSIFKHIRIISYLPKPLPLHHSNLLIYSHLRYTKDKGRGK